MRERTNAVPDPGTDEAINAGCTCAVIDNHYGRGYRGQAGVFVITVGCPVHHPLPATDATGASHEQD